MARRFRRRQKKRFFWTGFANAGQTLTTADPTPTYVLLGPPTGTTQQEGNVDVVLERTILELNYQNIDETVHRLGAYLYIFDADITSHAPLGGWSALSLDSDALSKRVLWWRELILDPGHGGTGASLTPLGMPYEIPVKRKLGGDKVLCLVFTADAANAVTLHYRCRTLFSAGRR